MCTIKNKSKYRGKGGINWERILFFTVFIFYVGLFFFTYSDPFFGDAKSTISRLAYPAFESNFEIWLYPKGIDPGHPVLVPLFHAFLWKTFGAHLWISHLFTFCFTLLALVFAASLDKHYQSKGWLLLLVAINPLFVSLAASLNSHIILVACFLGFHFFYTRGRLSGQIICLIGLLLTHNQGMLIAVVLLIAHLFTERNAKQTIWMMLAFIPWGIWLFIHHLYTGWFLFPPEYAEFRGVGSLPTLLKNAAIITWRLADFGLFFIILIALFYLVKHRNKAMIYIVLIALGIIGSVWLSVKFSIAHRYLIFTHLILTIPASLLIIKQRNWLKYLTLVLLLSGSFWYYPGKQLSDANIQYRHYFCLYKTIQSLPTLSNHTLYSTPPNESESTITHLSNDTLWLRIKSLSEVKDPNTIHKVMHGNVCGPLPLETKELVSTWDYITIQSGPAWVNIYSKAPFNSKMREKFPKRKVSWFEQKMKDLKKQYK